MALDPAKNFAEADLTAGIAAGVTSFSVQAGYGARFPDPAADGAFNVVCYNATDYQNPADDPYREVFRVTARAADAFTVNRAQESTADTAKNLPGRTYRIVNAFTAGMRDALQSILDSLVPYFGATADLNLGAHNIILGNLYLNGARIDSIVSPLYLSAGTTAVYLQLNGTTKLTLASAVATFATEAAFAASTSSAASVNIPDGADVTSPSPGDIWFGKGALRHAQATGFVTALEAWIYAATASVTLTGTTNEVDLISATGEGNKTLPKEWFREGRTLKVTAGGRHSTPASSPTTMTFKLYLNAINVVSTIAITPATSMTNRGWQTTFYVTCRTTGAGGTIMPYGHYTASGSATGGIGRVGDAVSTAPVSYDTNKAALVELKGKLASGAGSDSWTCDYAYIECMN